MLTYGEYCQKCETLTKWAKAYAVGQEVVPDSEYDAVYRQLKEYEMYNPDMILEDSPTRHVIDGAADDGFPKVKHDPPMISIANSNGIGEAVDWVKTMFLKHGVREFELEYKLDGLGLANIYYNGNFNDSVTRGKDNIGDSVAANALQIAGIPHSIPCKDDVREVRGEVLWYFDDFDAFNEELIASGKKALVNPRSGAAGTLKSHDPVEVGRRKLHFIAYIVARGSESETQLGDIEWLESQGFEVPPHALVTINSLDDLETFKNVAEDMRGKRNTLPYAIDGIVIKVNQKSKHDELGYTAKTPNFYRAYKFPPEEKDTELIDLEQSIGMSGAITPVAILKPVHLAMTTVQRCSLHNWDLVEYLGLYKGCHVTIRKAGEIIPEIVKCVETGRSKDDYDSMPVGTSTKCYVDGQTTYSRPFKCPFCGKQLVNQTSTTDGRSLVAWLCKNPDCDAQLVERIVNFADRTVMNIRGLGDSTVQELVDAGKIHAITDLYELKAEDLIGLGNIREKSANKLISAINASRSAYLHQLIEGFSIPGVGHQVAPLIAECLGDLHMSLTAFVSISSFEENTLRDSMRAKGVTDRIADLFIDWVKHHSYIVDYFCINGIAQEVKKSTVVSSKLAGQSCIMTGVFDQLDRDVFKKMVVDNGGKVCSGISKNTTIVLMGEGAGPSKVEKITQLIQQGHAMKVFTPQNLSEFLKLVE